MELPKIGDRRGDLTYVESRRHIPFDIARVYYLYGVPTDAERGAHGHRELEQLIIAVAGSVELVIDDGHSQKSYTLDDPTKGLYLCPMVWRDLRCFSSNAVVLVLASHPYDERDYFRDYLKFKRAVAESERQLP
ncbi:WxcM-like domain-containing protein [Porphyrobacter algicida]|uniref:WxcM-like domain-containing protein n=1 Tax=Qipengyuania algicida TaxID=1836209 RepID=A0A845AEX6_9SPHN|nr:FdtA/QdtA family cupin domain-containing protein [Qipengyuania algicida]MXP27959.1 WxcM-like domain-containing protein [Qipengyuania algicida]